MKTLVNACRNKSEDKKQETVLAVKCLCNLLMNHYQFNLADTVYKAIIPFVASKCFSPLLFTSRDEEITTIVTDCFSAVFKGDAQGRITYSIVSQMAAMVRSKENKVPPKTIQMYATMVRCDEQIPLPAAARGAGRRRRVGCEVEKEKASVRSVGESVECDSQRQDHDGE